MLPCCASQGRCVPSLTYLLFIPWLGTPGGQGGLLLGGGWPSWPGAREGKEREEDACSLPGPLPYSPPPKPPLLTFPLLSSAESSEYWSTDLKVQRPTNRSPTRVTQQTNPRVLSSQQLTNHSPLPFNLLQMPEFYKSS